MERFAVPVYRFAKTEDEVPAVIGVRLYTHWPVLTRGNLPPPSTKRWVLSRKAELAAAVHVGLISWNEIASSYRVRRQDIEAWISKLVGRGPEALLTLRAQDVSAQVTDVSANNKDEYTHSLSYNEEREILIWNGASGYEFTELEQKLICALLNAQGAALSKDSLMYLMYDGRGKPAHKTIDVFVCKTRKKLVRFTGSRQIETEWGNGYYIPSEKKSTSTTLELQAAE
jgi:DNA-binding winged helix-turn-helix (wHTH) protein